MKRTLFTMASRILQFLVATLFKVAKTTINEFCSLWDDIKASWFAFFTKNFNRSLFQPTPFFIGGGFVVAFLLTSITSYSQCATVPLPYTESFDVDEGCFTIIDGGSTSDTWQHSTSSTNLDGTNFMIVDSDAAGSGSSMIEILESPVIDASAVSGVLTLEFDQYFNNGSTDSAFVDVYDGSAWVNVYKSGSDVGSYSSPDHQTLDITAHANASLQVRFRYNDNNIWAWYWAVDNFSIADKSCSDPTALGATNITTNSADLYWTGGGASDWNVEYGPAGFAQGAGTMVNATNDTINITGLSDSTAYDFYVRDSCAVGDVSAWVGPGSFTTACPVYTAPYLETFTGGSTPKCWEQYAGSGGPWVFTGTPDFGSTYAMPDHTSGSTNNFAWVDQSGSDAGVVIEGPTVDVSSLTNPQLSYWVVSHSTNVSVYNILYAEAWDGSNWVSIDSVQGEYGLQWVEFTVDLAPYVFNTDQVLIRFRQESGGDGSDFDNDMLLDDVWIREAPTCFVPTQLDASNITTSSADLSWTTGGASDWNVEYGPSGFTLGTGTMANAANDTINITGLADDTDYEFYVRDSCGVGDVSFWAGPHSFTTLCLTDTIPYIQDFSSGTFPTCWTRSDATDVSIEATCDTRTNVLEFNQEEEAVTAEIDASGAQSIRVSYYLGAGACTNDPEDSEHFHVDYWDGSQWVQAKDYDGTLPQSFIWESFVVPQSALSSTFKVRFNMIDGTTDAWQIDSLVIEEGPSCVPPSDLGADNITSSSADIFWSPGGASDWNIEYDTTGFTQGAGTMINATNDTISITGLSATTSYDFYVRDSCGAGDVSSWVGPYSFTTLCAAKVAPWSEDFENGGSIPNCWAQGASNAKDWEFRNSGTGHIGNGGTMGGSTSSGGYFAWVDDSSPHVLGTTLESPLIDVSGLTVPVLKFYRISDNEGDSNVDFSVEVWDGSSWNQVYFTNSNSLNGEWEEITVDLSTLTITGNIQLRFIIDENNGTDFDDDVAIDDVSVIEMPSCVSPTLLGATSITAGSADLYWTTGGASDWNVEYDTAGFTLGTGNTLNATNDTVNITGLSATTQYEFYVRDSCGAGNVSSWVGPYSFTTGFVLPQPLNCTSGNPSVVFVEEFEAVNGWTGDINGGNDTWEIPGAPGSSNTGPDNEHSGPAGSFMNFEASNTSVSSGAIVSPAIDLSQGLTDAELSFWMHAYGAEMGTLTVSVGTSASGPFTPVFTWSGEYQTSGSDPWVNIGVDLSSYVGQVIYLEFHQLDDVGSFHGDMSIDLVEVSTCLTCPPPSGLSASNETSSGADISWTTGGASDWNIEYGPSGFSLGAGTMMNATNDTLSLSGLSVGTDYDFYVRDSCAAGDVSPWVGPFTFSTLCGVFPAPYLETFTGTSTPNCWSQSATTGGPWEFTGTPDFGSNYSMPDHTSGATNNYAWVDQSSSDAGVILEGPEVDVSGLTSPWLSYWVVSHNNTSSVSVFNILYAEAWDGNNWVAIDSVQGDFGLQWVEFTADLSPYIYNTNLVRVRFRQESGGDGSDFDNDMLLDDVAIIEAPTCFAPTSLSSTPASTTSADISWTTGGASDWNVEYGPAGFSPGSGTMVNATSSTYTVTGLTANLAYEFYVRDSCGVGDVSAWAGPFTFGADITPCEDFDTYTTGLVDPQSYLINGWAGAGGDAEISTDYASSGSNSLKIHDAGSNSFSDVVADVSTYNSGVWNVAVDVYVPTGYGGYYNILHDYQGSGTNVWAIEVSLDSNGTATVDAGTNGSGTIGTYAYNVGAWNTIEHIIDLDNDTAYIEVNGTPTNVGWQFSFGATGGDQFSAMNFYSTAPSGHTPLIYFDDFCISSVAPPCTPFVAPYTQSFDTDSVPACWSSYEAAGDGWQFGQAGAAGYAAGAAAEQTGNGGYYAWIDFSGTDDSTSLEIFDVDISALTTPAVQFSLFSENTNSTDYNSMIIEAWDGSSWLQVDSLHGDLGGWALFTYDLSSYVYSSNLVRLRFRGESGGGADDFHNDLLLDDVSVIELPLCLDPTDFMVTSSSMTTVDFSWTSDTNVTASAIEYGSVGFTLGTGTLVSTSTPGSITIGGLSANTCYDFYVQDSCGAGTNWVGPLNVCTKVACSVSGTPTNLVGDSTGCGGGPVTLTGTATGGQRLAWMLAGEVVGTGSSYTADSIPSTTIFEAANVNTAGSPVHLGPMPGIATAGFGNFTNGQYITVYDTVVIDSTTVRADGHVRAQVIITDGMSTSDGGTIIQRGEIFTTDTAVTANYQVPAGIVLTPGSYFIGIDFLPGTISSLFRATGGAVFPYVEPGLMSIDGVNFNGPRYYYTFDLVIQQACIGAGVGVVGYVPEANAGADVSDTICDSAAVVDLTTYLDTNATSGGTWTDVNASGGLTGSMFDPGAVAEGQTYEFRYNLTGGACDDDSASVTIFVEDCFIGLEEYTTGKLDVYPNPTKGTVHIEVKSASSNFIEVEVYSLNGQLVMKRRVEAATSEIDLSRMADGLYNLKITSDEGVEIHRITKE